MKSAKIHFERNIDRVKHLGIIYQNISTQHTTDIDLSDILRAQYVMLVSALDHFIHELVRMGMLEIYDEQREATKEFKDFIFDMDRKRLFNSAIMVDIVQGKKSQEWLESEIREKNSAKSFQHSQKIAEALKLFTSKNIWLSVSKQLNQDENALKRQLNLIVQRRNQIAHEADIEPTYQEMRDIHIDDINDSIKFVEELVEAIYNTCKLDEEQ